MRRLLYVARHGETDWNAQGRWQGHTDVPLNEVGRAQARALGATLRAAGVSAPAGVVASDLSRAIETARIAAVELGIDLSYVDADLRERALGVFEGLTGEECERLHPEAWRAWRESRRVPPGGEAVEALSARVIAAIERVACVARADAPALVVTHGGALRAVLSAVTGEPAGPIANGAVWLLTWDGQEGRIVAAEKL